MKTGLNLQKDPLIIGDDSAIDKNLDYLSNKQSPFVIKLNQGKIVAASSRGVGYKEVNEDRIMISYQLSFFSVIDGMGGPGDGEKATKILIEELVKLKSITFQAIQKILKITSNRIISECKTSKSGVSFLMCWIEKNQLYIGYLGDVKLILLDQDQKVKLETRDHSLINAWLDEGLITEEEALNHPQRNVITKALTGLGTSEMSTYQFSFNTGDRIIIGSDGLWDNFTVNEVLDMIEGLSPEESVSLLMEKGHAKMKKADQWEGRLLPKPDNISILVGDLKI